MKVVESHLQPLLNKDTISQYAGENIIPVMLGKLKSIPDVLASFSTLVGYCLHSEILCGGLLDEVLCCWVHAKCRQVIHSFIFALKSMNSKHGSGLRMGAPAMRKTLDNIK